MVRTLLLLALILTGCGPSAPAAPGAARTTAGLPFTLTPPPDFALALEKEKTKSWTPGGGPVKAGGPLLVLTRSGKVYPADDRVRRLSPEEMVKGLKLTNQVILSNAPITIDGMPGFEVTAKAKVADGTPVRVYCAALFAADGTFYVMATGAGTMLPPNSKNFARPPNPYL
jgi:hypothetical protein